MDKSRELNGIAMLRSRSQIVMGLAQRLKLNANNADRETRMLIKHDAELIAGTVDRMWREYDELTEERAKDAHLGGVRE